MATNSGKRKATGKKRASTRSSGARAKAGGRRTPARKPRAKASRKSGGIAAKKGFGVRKTRRKATRRRNQPKTTRLIRIAAGVLLLLGVLGAWSVIYIHGKFNRLMDARLAGQPRDPSVVYARSFSFQTGQRLTVPAAVEHLESSGYLPGRRTTGPWYVSEKERVLFGDPAGSLSEIEFRGDRVSSVRSGGTEAKQIETRAPLLSSLFGQSRRKSRRVRFQEVPDRLKNALLAAEDARFFEHHGIDLLGMIRAGLTNFWRGSRHGGSTLTQQFLKNHFLTPEKTWTRKLQEIYFALLLERRLSKEEIFELYCNDVYLGQSGSFAIHGFGQAARDFFGKDLAALTLSESAMMAGVIQAPNRYSPHRNYEAALERRDHILELMQARGFISRQARLDARLERPSVRSASAQDFSEAPYFVDYLTQVLENHYSVQSGSPSLTVRSTLDRSLQKAAFNAVKEGLSEVEKMVASRKRRPTPQAALVAIDPRSGEILAMIGGRDYASAQYNRATLAFRQPGSTFKPFVYATALQRSYDEPEIYNFTLSSQLLDEPYTFRFERKEYSPRNFGNRYHGPVTLRQALARSLNVPTVKLAEMVGFDNVLSVARSLEFSDSLRPYPSLALGTFEVSLLQLAQAYQALANQGKLIRLRAVEELRVEGVPLTRPDQYARHQVFSPQVAFLVTSALQSVLDEGTGTTVRSLGFELPAAGKTGSTDDAWFVGFTPELLCAVWVGTDEKPDLDLTGTRAALPIWTAFMSEALRLGYLSGRPPVAPPQINRLEIDPETGFLATRLCATTRVEYFVSGSEPEFFCPGHGGRLDRSPRRKPRRRFLRWLGKVFS